MQAMILAAGLGTRLKPITDKKPKALVEVKGRTLLDRTIENLTQAGADRIVINVHHFADQIKQHVQCRVSGAISHQPSAISLGRRPNIFISDESQALLDTGGGLLKARPLFAPDEPILIHNVDILSNVNLPLLYNKVEDADALLLVSERKTTRYLLVDQEMRLVGWTNIESGEVRSSFPEIKAISHQPSAISLIQRANLKMYAFSGIHIFSPRLFPLLEKFAATQPSAISHQPSASDEVRTKFGIMDFYLNACANSNIRGYLKEDLRLLDVGKLDSLAEAEKFIAAPLAPSEI